MGWFEVDKGGLRQLLEGRDKSFVLRELVQNAFDEEGVTSCDVQLAPVAGRALAWITVTDDAPEGFYDLTHAWTLYAPTRKRADAGKRGRFNLGEKQALALCREARITTTSGAVIFKGEERHRSAKRTERGSRVELLLPMTREEVADAVAAARLFLPPAHIRYVVNGVPVPVRDPLRVIEATLTTECEDAEGRYRTTRRKTSIAVHEVLPGERAMIFEMGLPIIETGDLYSYDIGQRVPMSVDRDNVSPSFLRDVRAEVLNAMVGHVRAEGISDAWVRDAMGDERIAEDAVREVVRKRWGDQVAVGVPGDAKSREEAVAHGYRVVTGSEMSEAEWDAVRAAGAIAATTALFPVVTAGAVALREDELTPGMRQARSWARRIFSQVFDLPQMAHLTVHFIRSEAAIAADYEAAKHLLRFNVQQLGASWFDDNKYEVLKLIIHELGHEGGGHLEHGYHETLCEIAAHLACVDALVGEGA